MFFKVIFYEFMSNILKAEIFALKNLVGFTSIRKTLQQNPTKSFVRMSSSELIIFFKNKNQLFFNFII